MNTAFASGCCYKTYNIKKSHATFKKNCGKKTLKHPTNSNVGHYWGLYGQYIGAYKVKGKRVVVHDSKGHRISYCKLNKDGVAIQYNRSGIAVGYCEASR